MAATAMIDRLIHHAEILSLKGDSYRLRGKDLDPAQRPQRTPPERRARRHFLRSPTAHSGNAGGATLKWPSFQPAKLAYFSTGLDTGARNAAIVPFLD